MIREHDRVVLTKDIPSEGLLAGDVGTVVHVHRKRKGYQVEFVALDGQTVAIAAVTASQIRPVGKGEITHARQLATA